MNISNNSIIWGDTVRVALQQRLACFEIIELSRQAWQPQAIGDGIDQA